MKWLTMLALFFLVSFIAAFAQESNATETNVTVPSNETAPTPPPQPTIVCSEKQCDKGCIKCSDRACHDQGFICVEEITLEKFFPNEINLGINQLNIVLKNTGNVKLDDIYAVVSGDGIETVEKIPLPKFAAGDRDYVFAKINVTKPGVIDIVIKIYVAGNVKHKFVDQITVFKPVQPAENVTAEAINVTQLTSSFDQLKQKYRALEQEYQAKKAEGYPLDIVYDKLRETSSYITQTQSNLFEGEYKKVKANLGILESTLKDIGAQLKVAKKKEETLSDKIRNNLLLIGSLAASIVSIYAAYRLIQASVNKQKLLELHKKLSAMRKSKGKKDIHKKAKEKSEEPKLK